MEVTQILTADFNDILFEGRNKEYGAYQLRRNYNKRLMLAIGGMTLLCAIVFAIGYMKRSDPQSSIPGFRISEPIELIDYPDDPEVPVPPKKPEMPQIKQVAFTSQIITVPDNEMPEDAAPPEVTDMENATIGTSNIDGIDNPGIVTSTVTNNAVIAEPVPPVAVNENKIWEKVEIESQFPGGPAAWMRFLLKTFRYPAEAEEKGVEGTVLIRFVVDKEGSVSNVEVISGPEELKDEAVRVIRKSGRWTPAIQNGRPVNSYKQQSIVFMLQDEE